MSQLSDEVFSCITRLFPHNVIVKEHYINYKGKKLFFDFYIKDLGILVECQGAQHDTFVKHFHDSKENFIAQKRRDNLKLEYLENTPLTLVYFYDKIDKITDSLVLDRIYKAQCGIK